MLFGGSFDPPHIGHAAVASAVLRARLADEVWFVPCGAHPFGRSLSPAEHRVAMTQLIVQPGTAVCTFETDKTEPSYSVDTLATLSALHPQRTFSWLMGSDQLHAFDEWKDFERLLATWRVYVYPRKGYPLEPLYQGMTPLVSMREIDVSSTIVRKRLEAGEEAGSAIEREVAAYIGSHRLYHPSHAAAV